MPVIPCGSPVNCLGVEEAVSNLSAEGPDIAKCFRYSFGPQSQAVCEFNLSLCSAFSAVGADVGIFCNPPGPGGPNPPAPVIYSSSAQSCIVDCADSTSETYTVVGGSFVALSQAEADADAFAFACQLAAMQCTGPVTTFTNTPQTCAFACPDGTPTSYTTPADFFTALSQAEANVNAFLFACDVAALLCGGPPVGTLPGSGTQPEQPVDPLYGNSEQSCGSICPDGSIFTYVIAAGTYVRESRAAANAVADSAACSLANSFRFCLSDLPAGACVNEFVFEQLAADGNPATTFSVSSGSLPPGLTLTSQGVLQGVPTTPGSFTFSIRATNGSSGNSSARSYTMAVGEITPAFLDDANTSGPYSAALTADGFNGSVEWGIVSGALPAPLVLNPNTGVISGDAPESDGDFAFSVSATDGSLVCTKSYVLHVEGVQVQAYWRLEGPPAANHDEITGDLLTYNNFGAVLTSPAAVVGNGLDIGGAGACTVQQQGPTLAYAGPNGFSVALWIRWSSAGTGNEGFVYQWDNIGFPGFLSWIAGTGEFHFSNLGLDTTGNTAIPAADVFHFVVFTYDPTDNNLRFSVDGAAFVILGTPGIVTPIADPTAYLLCGNEASTFDEVQLYAFPLRAVDVTYLFNAGAGRVYPPSFPP